MNKVKKVVLEIENKILRIKYRAEFLATGRQVGPGGKVLCKFYDRCGIDRGWKKKIRNYFVSYTKRHKDKLIGWEKDRLDLIEQRKKERKGKTLVGYRKDGSDEILTEHPGKMSKSIKEVWE